MTQTFSQQGLFTDASTRRYPLDGAEIVEHFGVFTREETARYFTILRNEINWQSASVRIAGKLIPIPRLQCWVADAGLTYAYSGIGMVPDRWTDTLLEIRRRVESLAGQQFNAVLLNLYRTGQDSVAWHADDEPELGPNPVVASVSLGASRPFALKPRQAGNRTRVKLMLHDGSVLVMGKNLQNNWLHQLPKVKDLQEPRINLTFRQVLRALP